MHFEVISRDEIISGIKLAKNPRKQRKIYAELCGCSVSEIDKIIEENKKPMSKRFTEEETNKIVDMVNMGKSDREIASYFPERDIKSISNKVQHLLGQKRVVPRRKKPFESYSAEPQMPIFEEESNTSVDELQYYKDRCKALEQALKNKTKELINERAENEELRILAELIGKAVAR